MLGKTRRTFVSCLETDLELGWRIMEKMWKDIAGFEGRYEISEDGVIRNTTNGKTLTSALDSDGYKQIGIRKLGDRKKYWFKIHRLVALAFLELPDNYTSLQIDHIDRDKVNNDYRNLRWVTNQENCNNRKDTSWATNITTGELHITRYVNGFMLRINKHDLKHRSWHKTLESAVNKRDSLKSAVLD